MLNRNAARHLLLVVSILLCAFIYAGYYLATRGEADPADAALLSGDDSAPLALRPSDDAAGGIPAADGDALSLSPPVGQSLRPAPSAPAAAASDDSEEFAVISGLVPETSDAPESSASSGMMPGASLPIPGFASASSPTQDAADESGAATQSPPVLALPGMAGASGETEEFADEDFGGEEDFAALPGFDSPAEASSAPVLTPAPAAAALAPPPATGAGASSAASAPETGTVLRPPAPSRSAASPAAPAAETPPPASTPPPARTPPPPPPPARRIPESEPVPTRTPPPPPPGMEGMADEDADADFRSDSLRIYVVAPGDTLSSIAMRELGSGFLADNIFLLNRDVIDDPNHLMVGMKIRLPYANPDASGLYEDPVVPGAGGPGAPGRRPTQGLGSTHTVVRGDTLSSIALQYYGSSAAWQFLYESNKAIVPNPNQLTVGMQLTIPPYEE